MAHRPRTDAKKPRQAEAQRGQHTHRLTEKSAHRRRQQATEGHQQEKRSRNEV